jgi:uncharacterized protein (TIGR02246 family)
MESPPNQDDAVCIRLLDEAWAAATARRDLDGMMAIYAPEAQELLPGHPPIVGREAIRRFYQGLLEGLPRFAHQFEPEVITVARSRDLAFVRGRYRFTADTLHPAEAQLGKFVGVWARQGAEWRLLINISNAD